MANDTFIKSHRDLTLWRKAMDVAKSVYSLTDDFPKKEEYRMTSQLIRAAISIPANIAEGVMRKLPDRSTPLFFSMLLKFVESKSLVSNP